MYSAEYLIDEPGMGIVVADGRRNLKAGVFRFFFIMFLLLCVFVRRCVSGQSARVYCTLLVSA